MHHMLDTNICIYIFITKSHPPQVLRRLESLTQGSAVMSVVTYAELRAGLEMQTNHRAQDERALKLLAQRISVLPFDKAADESYVLLRAAVRERSRSAMDRLIAAHAVSVSITLVTNNDAYFKDYPGLVVENWALPKFVV